MTGRPAGGRRQEPDGPTRSERLLRGTWIVAAFLAVLMGVFVVPIQFIDARDTARAQRIESSDAEAYPVLEIRQRVGSTRTGYVVEEQVATYRSPAGTATVELRSYDSSAVVRDEEGWFAVPVRGGPAEVFVSDDGRTGYLAEDYRLLLDGGYDGLYRAADSWIGGWALVGLGTLTWLSVRRTRRGVTSGRRAVLAPALYCAVAAGLVPLAYGVSLLLDA
ncbi:hypothetical protein [Blastococcus haudaquaticus]|uniref:Uncharacterized protein n=1 Tax=Blastococcus haudaquaticus TaxID=1938745 RepID=A0A286GZP4_9ACTN|nr:hypothetical protein [Blastococcus haudaquaticus]SOE00569.1 hypothetical protein SAMN06272739_2667 [Blastococcus haudaquaticus]